MDYTEGRKESDMTERLSLSNAPRRREGERRGRPGARGRVGGAGKSLLGGPAGPASPAEAFPGVRSGGREGERRVSTPALLRDRLRREGAGLLYASYFQKGNGYSNE